MAEKRHISRTGYGSPGLLAYLPLEHLEDGTGTLESYRFPSEFPHFKIIGPLKTLYASSFPRILGASSRLWWERRSQTRWLFKNCPDAFVGDALFRDVFKEDAKSTRGSHQEMIIDRPLLAVGHLPVNSEEAEQRVMALPAGESGQLLRIARMNDSQWQWGDARDAFVNISTVNPAERESEATWEDDGLPIIQIKFATDGLRDGVEDWLLVQKETSTVLLRPEYRESAKAAIRASGLSAGVLPSLIDPNPIVTIRHSQTGDRAHADVALIPATSDQPSQVAIIDNCGYWIIWDLAQKVLTRRNSFSLDFSCCGHIEEGCLDRIPLTTSHPSRAFGLLFVGSGPAEVKNPEEGSPPLDQKKKGSAAVQSRHLVIWNEEQVAVLDIETQAMLPKLGRLQTDLWKQDPVLDIQRDPLHQNNVIILTRQRLFWVDLLGSQESKRKSPAMPAILLQCPHLGTARDDTRMFACRASDEDQDTICVFVYYPERGQMCVFWFRFSANASIPQWNRDTISLPGDDEVYARCSIKHIRVDQAQLVLSTKPNAKSPGIDYDREGVLFYHLSILWDDLSLQHCMCAISTDPGLTIDAPNTLVDWLDPAKPHQQRARGRGFKSRIFILPDGATAKDEDASSLQEGEAEATRKDVAAIPGKNSRGSRPVVMKFDKMCAALQASIQESMVREDFGLSAALFEFLRDTLDEEQGYDRLPLLTWREIAEQLPGSDGSQSFDIDTEQAIQELFGQNGEHKVFTQLKATRPDEISQRLVDLPSLGYQFSRLWLDPAAGNLPQEAQRYRRKLVSEVARDDFLSTYGVMIQDTPLLGPQNADAMEESQLGIPLSSLPRRMSLSSPGMIMSSSPPRPAAPPTEDGAVQRLRMLCSGLEADKLDMSKQSKVISYWPAERGADPAEYISTIVRANEELLRGAKERLKRIEAKRKARAEKYKRPAFMRQGLPDLDAGRAQRDRSFAEQSPFRPSPIKVMSSQRFMDSSQIQGVAGPSFAMSQPVAGAFGDRKKVKKAKRKSGFR
ncbi:hypothetical protein ESCO_001783 [Escovopsis weberi]|uniref:RNA polymerase I-specific transcription initiation factor RRN6 n=1 Tax=Escovopsis weberi TaxID=150374 RepID=A0A0M8N084_ESCWE|nr:hypothetical protein ESCO_001783 [Escovopsis weberi]